MSTSIKVATLNVHNRHDRWAQRRHLIVAEIMDQMPHLVSLQEINFPMGQGKWLRNQINSRISGSPRQPYRLVQERMHHVIHGYFEGVGILTRVPVISHDALNLGYDGRVALRANVELPTGDSLDFVTTHLHAVAHDREARLEQVMLLIGWLNDTGRVPLQVIAGDFNEIPSGPAIQYMKQTYHSALEETRGYEPLATFPTALTPRSDDWSGCLDYIFISSTIAVEHAALFANIAHEEQATLYPSDHVGLVALLNIDNHDAARVSASKRV